MKCSEHKRDLRSWISQYNVSKIQFQDKNYPFLIFFRFKHGFDT